MPEIKFKRSRFSRALDHWISFSFFYLKVYLNMSRLSTVCVKRHPTGDKNRVCQSVFTSGRVWRHKNSIIYAPPNALYGRLTLTTESHRIVYPWDVFLRYKRRKRGQVVKWSICPFHRFVYVYLDFRSFRIQALMTRISYSKYAYLVHLNWYPVEYKHRNCARVSITQIGVVSMLESYFDYN